MREVIISSDVSRKFPGIKIAYLYVYDVKTGETSHALETIKREVEKEVRDKFTFSNLLEDKNIGSWNRLFSQSGLDTKIVQPAQEALVRRILRGKSIPRINNIVDCANIIAAKCGVPCGAFDLDKIEGNIVLRLAMEGESILPLFEDKYETVPVGEIVYADDVRIFSRYSKDSDITKITSATINVFFVIDGTAEVDETEIKTYRDFLADLVKKACDGIPTMEEGYIAG